MNRRSLLVCASAALAGLAVGRSRLIGSAAAAETPESLLPEGGSSKVPPPGAAISFTSGAWSTTAGAGREIFSLGADGSSRPLRVAFAAPSPGKIVAVDLSSIGGTLICQRGAFLGGTRGVRVGLAFKKRLRAGLFGGEGFVMQRISGNGTALRAGMAIYSA